MLPKCQNFIHLHKPHCPPYLGSKVVCWCCLLSASNWGFCMVLSCIRQAWSWARFATCKYTGASTFCCIDHVFTTFAWKIVWYHSININAQTCQVMQQSGHQPLGWPFHVLYQPHVALQVPINLCRCLSKPSQILTVTEIAVCLIICSTHWKFIWITLRNTWRLFFPSLEFLRKSVHIKYKTEMNSSENIIYSLALQKLQLSCQSLTNPQFHSPYPPENF